MPDKALWQKINIEEIQKRTIKFSELNRGKIIILNENKEINFVLCVDNESCIITKNLIDYEELKKAETIDKRISIVLDAVRDFGFYFFFEKEVTNLIING